MNAPEILAPPAVTPAGVPPGMPPAKPPAEAPVPPPGAPDELKTLLGTDAARPWYRRPALWITLLVLLLAAAGGWYWWAQRTANAAPVYTTQPVTRGDLTLSVSANGTVQPTRAVNIGSELSGTVLKVNVDVNDRIRRGQVLVVLDTAKLRDQVRRAQAALAAARSQTALRAATSLEARATLARLEQVSRLSGGQVPSATELDAARATVARAAAEGLSAQAGVDDALAALSTDETNLGKASITAPSDGVVLTRTVDPGNAVAASLQAVTLFTVAEDLAKLRLWVYVDEADVGVVRLGQRASFTVSAYPSRAFPARITRVGLGSTITDNVVTYLTWLDVDNADLSLRPGMTASATIVATERRAVLQVPNAALRFTPTVAKAGQKGLASGMNFGPPKTESQRKGAADSASTASARQVWVLPQGADGRPVPGAAPVAVAVMPGISDGRNTEITAGALTEGMQVITAQATGAAK
jgi:HlyD family secretion protein